MAPEEKSESPTLIEQGVIYFFTRPRVNVEEPHGVKDLQRTFFVLRPISANVKLEEGLKEDGKNNRLLALPKKVFPKSPRNRVMAFVEKGQTSIKELKESFLPGEDYMTKTRGMQHKQQIMPIAEGVYSITHVGRSSYLSYILTIPDKIGEVQNAIGLQPKGSFIISVKNPERPGPANVRLPEGPKYPKELLKEFRDYAWISVQSKLLDYDNVQILLIGHGEDISNAENVEPLEDEDEEVEDIDELAEEDANRVDKISGNDPILDDLHVSKKDYPSVSTTW